MHTFCNINTGHIHKTVCTSSVESKYAVTKLYWRLRFNKFFYIYTYFDFNTENI